MAPKEVMPKPTAEYTSPAAISLSTRGTSGTASVGAMLSERMRIAWSTPQYVLFVEPGGRTTSLTVW